MPNDKNQRKVGQVLLKRGLITEAQLNAALREQSVSGRFLGEILVSRGAASEEQIARTLSEQLGFAYVDLENITIEPKAVNLIPEELCIKNKSLPLYISRDAITIAMANPLDLAAIDELHNISKLRIKPVFASYTSIRSSIEKSYHPFSENAKAQANTGIDIPTDKIESLKQAASLAPVIDMVNNIVTRAVEMNASDIHLEPERTGLNCRYRVDGILYSVSKIAPTQQAPVISRIKIMANLDIAEKRLPQDGRIRMFAANRDVDLRVSTFPTLHGENLVMRILDRSGGILKLEQLGFSKKTLKQFNDLIHRPYGIVLVTGPTGSGKTTTLYGALGEINSVEKNIITLEDPVEYEVANVRQSQVNVKAGLTFAAGLRSIVRQDPDIIMIGEIRDKETAEIAIHAALTGHLVFSTLHTNDAPSAATRLIDMGVEPFLVASSIIGILAQRLVRILCPHCSEAYVPPKELIDELCIDAVCDKIKEPLKKSLKFSKERGCKKCKDRGYIGRTGIYEFLIPTDKIKDMIATKSSATDLRDEAVKNGMQTLRNSGLEKVIDGVTSVAEILRVTEEI